MVLTREATAAGVLPQVAEAAAVVVPIAGSYAHHFQNDSPRVIRKLRLALYAGDHRAVLCQESEGARTLLAEIGGKPRQTPRAFGRSHSTAGDDVFRRANGWP